MKRRLARVLVALVLVGVIVVMILRRPPEVRQKAELSFLYFTNAPASSLAVFAAHFPKHYGGSSWKEMELDRWEGGRWTPWSPSHPGKAAMQFKGVWPMGTVVQNGQRIDFIAEIFIPDTNDSWRIRTPVEEERPVSLLERLPVLGPKIREIRDNRADPWQTFDYWVTNVVGPAGARP
jgi:hypothetical protein